MTSTTTEGGSPRLCIGLPVYNGERFIGEAVTCHLRQTFDNFEIVISDNASSDGTEQICRDLAHDDERIRYVRQAENIGAAGNFNAVFGQCRSALFKWAAADDVIEPTYLERCIAELDRDLGVVLATSRVDRIDENGRLVGHERYRLGEGSRWAPRRFVGQASQNHSCFQIFGVVRTDVLARTTLHGPYIGSDRDLLAELALHGRFAVVDEYLLHRRVHDASFSAGSLDRAEKVRFYRPQATPAAPRPPVGGIRTHRASIARADLGWLSRWSCRVAIEISDPLSHLWYWIRRWLVRRRAAIRERLPQR